MTSAPRSTDRRRLDIQALRAVAVVLVVAEHVTGAPSGGFVGVDVFFVVSGFLITGLLLREADRSGRVSLADFWRRRVRRIVPAAVLVLVAGTVATLVVSGGTRGRTALVDAAWSAASLANWHFAATGTDYFRSQGPPSPFQHYWSLAVEEQFYLVWPAVLVAIVALARRRGHGTPRVTIACVLLVVVLASFVTAWVQSTAAPTVAYFSSATRAWELALGALLATAAPACARLPHHLRAPLAWVGLVGIVASAVVTTSTVPFPAPGALLPVVATMVVLAAGTGASRPPTLGPLTSRPVLVVGDLSFAVYLWHFVVLVLAEPVVGDDPAVLWTTVLVATAALSALTHHLVERPMIASPLLAPGAGRRAWVGWRRDHDATWRRGGLALLVVTTASAAALAVAAVRPVEAPPVPPALASSPGPTGDAPGGDPEAASDGDDDGVPRADVPALTTWSSGVVEALAATSWPDLEPSIDSVLDGTRTGSPHLACGDTTSGRSQEQCTWGPTDAAKTAVLVGDSTAMHELDALVPLVEVDGSEWRLVNRARFACPFVDVPVQNEVTDIVETCRAHNAETLGLLDELRPDLVLVTNSYQPLTEDGGGAITPDRWAEGFAAHVGRVAEASSAVAVLTPPPDDADLASCHTRGSTPVDCISRTSRTWVDRAAAEREAVEAVGGTFVDLRPLTCVDDLCPAFVGTVPVKEDRVHLTTAFARAVSPVLGDLLRAEGLW